MGVAIETATQTVRALRSRAPLIPRPTSGNARERLTLLELVETVSEITDDDAEVVATVMHMIRSGVVELCGNFRGEPSSQFGD